MFTNSFSPLEHDPEKWEPVFGKDHAQTKKLEPTSDFINNDKALAHRQLSSPSSHANIVANASCRSIVSRAKKQHDAGVRRRQ
jgi:hypothetical protein